MRRPGERFPGTYQEIMMKKQSLKKLALAKETVKRLEAGELGHVGGGAWNTQFDGCYTGQIPSPCPSRLC